MINTNANPISHKSRYRLCQKLKPISLNVGRDRDELDGFWPSGLDDEDLDQNASSPPTAPQPQTAADSTPAKGSDKKSEQPIDLDDAEPSKKKTPAAETPGDAKKPDVKKPEDETKKMTDEDAAKKANVDSDQKKSDDERGQKKAETDAAAKKAEAKRKEDLNNHMT